MRKLFLQKTCLRRWTGAFLLIGMLPSVAISSSAAAARSTTVTWKVSTLLAGESKNLSALVSTNSPGVKTWSKKGSCTLTPTKKPVKLTMGSTGSCVVTLKIAKSKSHLAKSSTKTIALVAPSSTTTAAPITTTTVSTTTSTTIASSGTIRNSGLSFTPTNLAISVGQSVAFIVDSSHNVRWQDGDPGRGATGAPYSRRFSNAGTYSFFCSIHPEMTGTINVS